ncbi:hypothetical protein ACWC10_05420 [Streptomyces sp. NPDC001595]
MRLLIDRVVPRARAVVATVDDSPELDLREFDPDLRNNTASILVN